MSSKSHVRGPLSYDFVQKPHGDDGRLSAFVHATCGECGATHDMRWDQNNNPEKVRFRFERIGWTLDPWNLRRCRCQACREKKHPIAKEAPVSHNPVEARAAAPLPASVAVRDPTSDDKRRMRDLLDRYFDDKLGLYLESYSDQRIGKELDLPWLMVQRYRDQAYAPLKVDPELVAFQNELNQAKRVLADLEAGVKAQVRVVDELQKRHLLIAKRFANGAA